MHLFSQTTAEPRIPRGSARVGISRTCSRNEPICEGKKNLNTTFEYDNYNLLKKINWPGSVNTQFLSDSAGNRVRMTTSTGTQWNFIYDTTAGIPAVLMERAGTQTPFLYVRTPDGRLIARVEADSTPSLDCYYHFDGLGSTLALTGSTGTGTDYYTYDVWGNAQHESGGSTQPYQFVGQLGYYTHNQDTQFSTYFPALQLGVRYYMPQIGRFTQQDPIKDKGNWYAYADNIPTAFMDPAGLKATKAECGQRMADILRKAGLLVNELRKYNPKLDGQGGFCTKGGGTTKPGGHYEKIRNLQEGIKNDIKWYLAECIKNNDDGNPPLPRWVDQLAARPVPVPIYPPAPKPCSRVCTPRNVGIGVGAGAGLYIGYRCIRMLPSLAPPLWWTLPVNAACP